MRPDPRRGSNYEREASARRNGREGRPEREGEGAAQLDPAESAAKIDAPDAQNVRPFELFATRRVAPAEQVAPPPRGDEVVAKRGHACQFRSVCVDEETSLFAIKE